MINDNYNPDELFRSAFENEKVAFDESSWEKVLPLLAECNKKRRRFFWILPAGLLMLVSSAILGFYTLSGNKSNFFAGDETLLAQQKDAEKINHAANPNSSNNLNLQLADDEDGNNSTNIENNQTNFGRNTIDNQAINTSEDTNLVKPKKQKKGELFREKSSEKNKKNGGNNQDQINRKVGKKGKSNNSSPSTGNSTLDNYLADKSNVTPMTRLGFNLFSSNPNLSLKKNSLSDENNTVKKDSKKMQSEPAFVANYMALGFGSFQTQSGIGFTNFQVYQQKEHKHFITGIGLGLEYNKLAFTDRQYSDTSYGFGSIISDVTVNQLAQFNLQLPLILGYRINNNHQLKAIFEPTLSFGQQMEIRSVALGPLDQTNPLVQTNKGWQYNAYFRPQFKIAYQYRVFRSWHAGIGVQQGINPQNSAYFFNLNYQFR